MSEKGKYRPFGLLISPLSRTRTQTPIPSALAVDATNKEIRDSCSRRLSNLEFCGQPDSKHNEYEENLLPEVTRWLQIISVFHYPKFVSSIIILGRCFLFGVWKKKLDFSKLVFSTKNRF